MNLNMLAGLTSQLEANTQALNRAQQDKSFSESVLAQQVAALAGFHRQARIRKPTSSSSWYLQTTAP